MYFCVICTIIRSGNLRQYILRQNKFKIEAIPIEAKTFAITFKSRQNTMFHCPFQCHYATFSFFNSMHEKQFHLPICLHRLKISLLKMSTYVFTCSKVQYYDFRERNKYFLTSKLSFSSQSYCLTQIKNFLC